MSIPSFALLALTLLTAGDNGVEIRIDAESKQIDPARSVFLTLTLKAPQGVKAVAPDLRERARGFSVAEDFEEDPVTASDGSVTQTVNWKLVPEPCAETYKIAPFVVKASPKLLSRASDDGRLSFVAGPVYFDPPAPRAVVTGDFECDPKKDLPPFSWKLAGLVAGALAAAALVLWGVVALVRYLARRVKEHRMSPVERAWAELDRLLKKGLPGRGRYKDYYVELTMVVRRYVQRQHGVKAPHLTTEEFFETARNLPNFPQASLGSLMEFLRAADLVKFAGVQATPETADDAAARAKMYISADDSAVRRCGPGRKEGTR